jgi:hypothetical protein
MSRFHPMNLRSSFLILFTLFGLVACTSAAGIPTEAVPTQQASVSVPSSTVEAVTEIQPTQPQATETPLEMSYRSILMLERAADLIITYLGDVQSGSIKADDPAVRLPFTLAFPIAIKTYNQTTPPAGMGQMWMNVTSIAEEFNKVYSLVQQGKPVAVSDYYNLKAFRQILANSQISVEAGLSASGLGQDYFSAEQQSVDQILQQEYGDIPVPVVSP